VRPTANPVWHTPPTGATGPQRLATALLLFPRDSFPRVCCLPSPFRVEAVPLKLDFCHTRLAKGPDHHWIVDRWGELSFPDFRMRHQVIRFGSRSQRLSTMRF
jgi:hypothetical protein